jgi:uncharacterized membrane protein YeiH
LFWVVFFATITAVWGWILRDIILNKTPIIFKYDLYATIAILFWFCYYFLASFMQNILYANVLILIFIVLRFIVIYKKLHLWKPEK